MNRYEKLTIWLKGIFDERIILKPASNDASFRKYYRLFDKKKTFIVMDAPPDKEDISSFISIGNNLYKDNIRVPLIYEVSLNDGFIVMEDFGSETYGVFLNKENAYQAYNSILDSLIKIQSRCSYKDIPDYSSALLYEEVLLFETWYLNQHKKIFLNENEKNNLAVIFKTIIESNIKQPQHFVHRDFHSRNLMKIGEEKEPGVIDFQDAVNGPITYDLVSLLKDAYFELEEDVVLDLVIRYWEKSIKSKLLKKGEFANFYKSFEMMGLQRHLKILGIFARLKLRDNKSQYLNDIPLVEKYLIQVTERYSELAPLRKILNKALE